MKSESRGFVLKTLERHPRVAHYDREGMDDGMIMVGLVKGFAFSDAAKRPEDDPDGSMAGHYRSCRGTRDALDWLRGAEPCHCGRCVA